MIYDMMEQSTFLQGAHTYNIYLCVCMCVESQLAPVTLPPPPPPRERCVLDFQVMNVFVSTSRDFKLSF